MLDKAQLKARYHETVDALNEPPHQVLLSAGGALVMLGLRETTSDLDLDVCEGVHRWLMGQYPTKTAVGGNKVVQFSEDVSLQVLQEDVGLMCVEGVWCYSVGELINQKRYLVKHPLRSSEKKEQDKLDLEQLEAFRQTKRTITASRI